MDKRIRVAVLYGGKSSEHEVSLESAKCVLDNLDPQRFDVLPIAIDRAGIWHVQDEKRLRATRDKALPVDASGDAVTLGTGAGGAVIQGRSASAIDVVFPVMHGPLCEDGSVQGLFELADVAYVGSGVLGSAICMDKDVAKRLVQAAGIATAEFLCLRGGNPLDSLPAVRERVVRELGYPVFVKPANLGSSVGVTRVANAEALGPALETAFGYDDKVLVERGIDAREIELAVLTSLDPSAAPGVSVPGEIIPRGGFYSYERKYLDPQGAELHIPAELDAAQTAEAQRIARDAFVALECDGMARVDLFLDRQRNRWLFNEVNTIPGFTTISMYPKLWEASGLPYAELLAHLIELAVQRHERRRAFKRAR